MPKDQSIREKFTKERSAAGTGSMSDELRKLGTAQIAGRVAFACGVTALVAVLVFFALLWLMGSR